jgi:hypothetical protein
MRRDRLPDREPSWKYGGTVTHVAVEAPHLHPLKKESHILFFEAMEKSAASIGCFPDPMTL